MEKRVLKSKRELAFGKSERGERENWELEKFEGLRKRERTGTWKIREKERERGKGRERLKVRESPDFKKCYNLSYSWDVANFELGRKGEREREREREREGELRS